MQLATLLVVAVALRLLSALRLAHCTADLVRIDAATNATYIRAFRALPKSLASCAPPCRPSQQAATKSCLGLSGSAVTAVLRRARCNCAPASFAGRVPCALEPNANLHAFATPGRKSWRDPPHASLCCVPKQGCFRAVLDGAVDLSPGTAGIRLEEKVLAVLKTELGVNEFVRFDTGRYKEYTAGDSGVYNDARLLRAGRKMTMAECELWAVGHDDRGCRPHQWSAMHADYFESARCGARTRTPWGIDPEGQRSGFGAVQCK